jgi:SLT domain-containing protein
MASYSYATLQVPVTADTRPLTQQVKSAATQAGSQASQDISSNMSKGMRAVGGVLSGVGKAAATGLGVATAAAAAFGVSSFKAAARVGEMDATLRALAKANKLSYPQMQKTVASVKATGIEAGVAQNLVAQFSRNQLDLAKSTQLAKVAQDAAVISGKNSTETLDALIHGVTTQNSLVLRNAGINVQAGQAISEYAKKVGKSTTELTASERAQAVLNATLKAGASIQGAYAQAMKEPGKVLRSFPRIIDDIKVSVGKGLVNAFGPVILKTYDLAKALSEAIDTGGKLQPIFKGIGVAAERMAKPLIRAVDWLTKLVKGVQPKQVDGIAKAIARFGPALSVAGAGAALFAGKNLLGNVPVLGSALQSLVGPIGAVSKGLMLLPGPVKYVVAGLGLLMSVSPEFRSAVMDVAKAILTAFAPAMGELGESTKGLAPPMTEIAKVLGSSLAVALRATIPLINALAAVIRFLGPALGPLVTGFLAAKTAITVYKVAVVAANTATAAGKAVMIAWAVVTKAATAGTIAQTVATWALNVAMRANPIGLVTTALTLLVAGIILAYKKFDWFRNLCNTVWRTIRVVWKWIVGGSPGLIPAFKALAVLLGGPVAIAVLLIIRHWRTLGNTIRTVYNASIKPVFEQFRKAPKAVADAFMASVRAIASAWNGMKKAVGAPVYFIAAKIINPLVSGANKLLSKIGMSIPAIPLGQIPKYAEGGRVPGGWGGGDRKLIWAEPGEWVLTKAQAKAIGYGNLRGLPHYFEGGQVGGHAWYNPASWGVTKSVGAGFSEVAKLGKNVKDEFSGMLQWAAAEAFKLGTKPLRKAVEPLSKSAIPPGFWNQAFGKFALQVLDKTVEFIEGKAAQEGDASGIVALAMKYDKHPYRWGGGANPKTGFDCSSFINMLAGMLKLPIPGGFKAPSAGHGPVTTDWMSFSRMKTVPAGQMGPGDIAVNTSHIILVTGKNKGFAARSTATGTGPQTPSPGYMIRRWPGMIAGPGGGPGNIGPMGPAALQKIAAWVLGKKGVGYLVNAYMGRLRQESGFNLKAVNKWDSNWKAGYPSVGVAQVIRPTFQAYAGPYRTKGPFMYGVSIDPLANMWASVSYSISRYGKGGLARAWAGTQGYAGGGPITEPIFGIGRSGRTYAFGERGDEWVSPLTGPGADVPGGGGRRTVINVYPQRGQSETQIAAAVSRRLAWAEATGRA